MKSAQPKQEESDRDHIYKQIAQLRKVQRWSPINRLGKLLALGPLGVLGSSLLTNNIGDPDAAAVRSLASQRDLRSLGCLLSFYNVGSKHIKETVEAAMLEILPRAREADGLTLEAGDRAALHKLLDSRAYEIAVGAFNSLQYLGDASSIQILNGIVSGKRIPRSLNYEREKIQAQAVKMIEAINERISGMKVQGILLRSGAFGHPGSDDLLTPAQEPGNVDADELLRANRGDGASSTLQHLLV